MVLSLLHDIPGNESNKEVSTVPMPYSNSHFLPKSHVTSPLISYPLEAGFLFFSLSSCPFLNPVTGIYISLLSSWVFSEKSFITAGDSDNH